MRPVPILLCLVIGVVGLAGSLNAGTPNDDSAIAAVFPPWWSASRSLAAASEAGAVLDGGVLPFFLIVQSARPGLGARLRDAGALLLLNPLGIAGCGPDSAGKKNV